MTDKAKALLSQKITSQEQLERIIIEAGLYSGSVEDLRRQGTYQEHGGKAPYGYHVHALHGARMEPYWTASGEATYAIPLSRWWVLREKMRLHFGVYEPIPDGVKGAAAIDFKSVLAHVSKDDRMMLAYTPTPVDGENDRQVRVAVGKFLRKMRPTLLDHEIQAIEAMWRAEMNDEVEFVTGEDGIMDVYQHMRGDSGCMRHGHESFDLPQGYHPSMVYDAPGLAVAVQRAHDGVVIARTVTYVDPDNPSDKRYVRIYGDSVLARKLERKGFRLAPLTDVRVRKVPVPSSRADTKGGRKYVMPYIDGAGGNADTSYNGRWAMIDGDSIRLLGTEHRNKLATALEDAEHEVGDYVKKALRTDGQMYLAPIPAGVLEYTCGITGQQMDRLRQSSEKVRMADGSIVVAAAANIPADWSQVTGGAGMETYRTDPAVPTWVNVDGWGRSPLVDDEQTRMYFGQVKLSATLYPDMQDWRSTDGLAPTPEGWVLKDDAVMRVKMVDGTPVVDTVHASRVQPTDVALYKRGLDYPAFAAADVEIQTTATGRFKVHPLVHPVVQLYDGTWDFTNKVKEVSVLGRRVWVYTNTTTLPSAIDIPDLGAKVKTLLDHIVAKCTEASREADIEPSIWLSAKHTLGIVWQPDSTGRMTTVRASTITDHATIRTTAEVILGDPATRTAEQVQFANNVRWLFGQIDAYLAARAAALNPQFAVAA